MPPNMTRKNFKKFLVFMVSCAFVLGAGIDLFTHDVLQMPYGIRQTMLINVLTLALLVPVYCLGLRIWSRPKNDTPT
jgi:hypothetical protein